ncbi:MAG: CRISPR-associated endoribonuclease Cas6 [Thermoanaerobacter sp.]|nr:CRISPR-associated endoribonuclease Cas6 [Thermoanaerobacter sp.]
MRVKISMFPREETGVINISLDFRRHFISFTKTLLQFTPFFSRFDETRPGYSPYVFHISFGKVHTIDFTAKTMTVRPPVTYIFSTGIPDLLAGVCNAAIAWKGKGAVLGLVIDKVELLPFRQLRKCHVHFRIPGHAVFRSREGYLDGRNMVALEEAVNCHLATRSEFLSRYYGTYPVAKEKVRLACDPVLRKGVCYHYGGTLTTVRGDIHLTGSPAVLQFLYDYGLGVRTGQGFGYVEVVREW